MCNRVVWTWARTAVTTTVQRWGPPRADSCDHHHRPRILASLQGGVPDPPPPPRPPYPRPCHHLSSATMLRSLLVPGGALRLRHLPSSLSRGWAGAPPGGAPGGAPAGVRHAAAAAAAAAAPAPAADAPHASSTIEALPGSPPLDGDPPRPTRGYTGPGTPAQHRPPPGVDITRPPVIQRRPVTPSQRHTALIQHSLLYRGRPLRRLCEGLRKTGGRSNTGQISVRHIGGGHKRLYRRVDFVRSAHDGKVGVIERVEYDPNRSALLALVRHRGKCAAVEGEQRPDRYAYILCPAGVELGGEVLASRSDPAAPDGVGVDVRPGNAMRLRFMPVGTTVHNVELRPGKGGILCRSAGSSAQLLERSVPKGLALLRLASKEQRYVPLDAMATVGKVSNAEHKNEKMGKAGRNRWKGIRPSVRGIAMNPIDHPHGGRTNGGRPSVSPWGWYTKGMRTRNTKKASQKMIMKRRPS